MKIALFSDIHLEHRSGESQSKAIIERLAETAQGCDLIINAGDTHHEYNIRRDVGTLLKHKTGARYIEVLGNHDFYGNSWLENNFNSVIEIGGFKILHGTMWTNFDDNPMVEMEAMRWISDFRWIWGIDGSSLTKKFNRFLEMVESEKPDIVVSHFAPHKGSVHPRFAGSNLNGYFCPNALERLEHKPKLWMHGHIHDPVDYDFRGTYVVANPMGYPNETYKKIKDYSCRIIDL